MPSDPKRIDHALALAAEGKPAEADTLLTHLARQDKDPLAAWHLAWLRLRAGDSEGALAILCEFPSDPMCGERAREMLVGERRNAEARRLIEQAPSRAEDPRSLVNAAIDQHLSGYYAGAADLCRRALALAPAHAPAHNHLGRALHNLGQLAAAQNEFERAVHADPRYPEAWHNLGHSLRANGQLERSCEALEQALAIAPGYRSARLNLGITRFSLEQPELAMPCFEELLHRNREDVEAMVNAGLCLQQLGQPGKARQRFERALELSPQNQWAHFYLGVLMHEQSDLASAKRFLQRALKLRPDDADAWAELASVHEDAGEHDATAGAIGSGLRVAPGHLLLNIEAAKMERRLGDNLGAEARLRRLDSSLAPSRTRQRYFHELGRVLDRNGRNEESYRAFAQANALAAEAQQRRGVDPAAFFESADAVGVWLAQGAPGIDGVDDGDGDQGADLCFLLGFPRSEHLLFDRALAAHAGVHVIQDAPTLESVAATLRELPGGYPDAIARLDRSDRLALRRMYRLALSRQGVASGTKVLDGSPLATLHAGLVQALFPKARLLFAARHPCELVLGNFMIPHGRHEAHANFHTLEGVARTYAAVMDVWWSLQARLTLPVAQVRYENLEQAPEQELAAVFDFLDLDGLPAVLEQIRAGGSAPNPARPPRRASRWQRYREPLEPLLDILAPHAQRLGYSLD
jgi:tetratricopeptide (TPR) repeat protein